MSNPPEKSRGATGARSSRARADQRSDWSPDAARDPWVEGTRRAFEAFNDPSRDEPAQRAFLADLPDELRWALVARLCDRCFHDGGLGCVFECNLPWIEAFAAAADEFGQPLLGQRLRQILEDLKRMARSDAPSALREALGAWEEANASEVEATDETYWQRGSAAIREHVEALVRAHPERFFRIYD